MIKTKTRTLTMFMDENAILHIIPHKNAHIDYEDALDNYLVMRTLSQNKPVLKLVDSSYYWSIEKKARIFIASKEIKEKTLARAIIKNSILDKVILNFLSRLHKPEVPTKIFTNYEQAYSWLMEMKLQ